jgi:hypothetical protein
MSAEFGFLVIDANQTIEAQQSIVRSLVAGKLDLPAFAHRILAHAERPPAKAR